MKKLYEYTVQEIMTHCHGMPFGTTYVISDKFYPDSLARGEDGLNQIPVTNLTGTFHSRYGDGKITLKELYQTLYKFGLEQYIKALEEKLDSIPKQIVRQINRLELILGAHES